MMMNNDDDNEGRTKKAFSGVLILMLRIEDNDNDKCMLLAFQLGQNYP